jgi:hypothetical protein
MKKHPSKRYKIAANPAKIKKPLITNPKIALKLGGVIPTLIATSGVSINFRNKINHKKYKILKFTNYFNY